MNLADHLGAANLQPRAARFTLDSKWFNTKAEKLKPRSAAKGMSTMTARDRRPVDGSASEGRFIALHHHTMPCQNRPLTLSRPEHGRQLVVPLGGLGAGGDNDLFGFIRLTLNDVDKLLPRVGRARGFFVRVREPKNLDQDLLGRLVRHVDTKRLVLRYPVSLQVGPANDDRHADRLRELLEGRFQRVLCETERGNLGKRVAHTGTRLFGDRSSLGRPRRLR